MDSKIWESCMGPCYDPPVYRSSCLVSVSIPAHSMDGMQQLDPLEFRLLTNFSSLLSQHKCPIVPLCLLQLSSFSSGRSLVL